MTSLPLRRHPLPIWIADGALALLMVLGTAYGLVGVIAGLTSDDELAGVAILIGGFVLLVSAPGLLLLVAGMARRARRGAGRSLLLAGRIVSVLGLLATAWWLLPWY